jgi:hypothetical protein
MATCVFHGTQGVYILSDAADLSGWPQVTDGSHTFIVGLPFTPVIVTGVTGLPADATPAMLVYDGETVSWPGYAGWQAQAAADLAAEQAQALVLIDAQAEACRLQWLTPGSGQALEYQETAAEAAAAAVAPDPLDPVKFPMLAAEMQAQIGAGVTPAPTLRQIQQQASAQQAAWAVAGTAIKQMRRTAKLKVSAATTIKAVNAIVAGLAWPHP